jgi:RND family efflux transporter MFP subunit
MRNEDGSVKAKIIPASRWPLAGILALLLVSGSACGRNSGRAPASHDHPGDEQADHVPAGSAPGEKDPGIAAAPRPFSGRDEHDHLHVSEADSGRLSWRKPELGEPLHILELMGVISADQDRSEVVTARIGGRIAAVKADVGQHLARGATLFILDSPELLSLKETFIRCAQEQRLHQAAYERARILLPQQGIEAGTAEERRAQAAISRARYLAAREALIRLGLSLRLLDEAAAADAPEETVSAFITPRLAVASPLAGLVLERDLVAGEWVSAEKPLFRITDNRRLWGVFNATAAQYEHLRQDADLELSIQGLPGPMPRSRILRIYPLVEESSRTVKVRLGFANPGGRVRPGMFASARLRVPAGVRRWLVAGEALTTINGVAGVFLHEGDGFRFLPLEQAERDGAGRLILPDALAGKEIVTQGVFALKSALLLRTAGGDEHAGHGH